MSITYDIRPGFFIPRLQDRDDPLPGVYLRDLASVVRDRGGLTHSLSLSESSLGILNRTYGPQHRQTNRSEKQVRDIRAALRSG